MKLINKIVLAGAVVVIAKGLDNRLEVSHYTIKSKKLPKEFDGFKIVHLSDFHCDTTAGLTDAVRSEHPDVICITGDMTHDTGSYEPFMRLLEEIIKIAPVYIVSGNHDVWRKDYDEMIEKCRSIGAIVLQNESNFIEKNSKKISIYGLEDPSSVTHSIIHKKIQDGLDKLSMSDGFNILLFHRANLLDVFKNTDFDLILSGHMHGGQFRIPGIGGVVSPKTNFMQKGRIFFPKYFGGEYALDDTKMIVSRGIGNPTILPRVFNRPEICSITLKSEN